MSIKIIHEPDVYLTADEVARYRREYEQAYSMYAGTPPTFESYCRMRKRQDADRPSREHWL